MISFIGYYNYTVILTYISLFCSIGGMLFTVNGWYKMAVLCLALSGLCDMFDGKIARRKTDRTEEEKCFGIQIDSLCDMVCFGAFPILLAYSLGMKGPIGLVILAWYGMNGVVRLGYFNVCETKRQEETEEVRKYYSGLPINIDRCRAAAGVCAAYGAEEPFCSGTSCGYVCCRYAVCDEYPGEKTQEFHTGSPGRRCCPGNLKNLSYFLVFNNDDQKPKCITEYCR